VQESKKKQRKSHVFGFTKGKV